MDPQVCLQRIIHAATRGDKEEIKEAMGDLRGWLLKGGAVPRCSSLGFAGNTPREIISSGEGNKSCDLMTEYQGVHGPGKYKFVTYTAKGEPRKAFQLG